MDRSLSPKELGRRGEQLAADHLKRLGYRLLGQNVRLQIGELDLVARDGNEVVFVEVKTRLGGPDATPELAVDGRKVARLARLAEAYLIRGGLDEAMWRIDVVAIVLNGRGQLERLEHFRNAVY